jgi:hypothetical protein
MSRDRFGGKLPMTRMGRISTWLVVAFLLTPLFGREVQANTITAASCQTSDVQAAVNSASDGDTVVIPNGSCTWTNGITTTKQITIQGASVGGVVITDGAGGADLLTMTSGNSYHVTIANLKFLPGTGTGNYITMHGTGTMVPLMHDMDFNLPNFQLKHAVQWLVNGGVIWNTTFESTNNLSGACGSQIGSDSGSLLIKSNIPWDDASTMGTLDANGDKNVYIEDSTFSYVGQAPDMDDNARVVLRHDTFSNISGMLTHGPTSAYGGRQVEIYDNTFSFTNLNRDIQRWVWGRAGTFVITGNSVDAITSGCHGSRDSWVFIVESATYKTGHGCCTSWMCWHQPGSGSDGTSGHSYLSTSQTPNDTYQQSDPIYIWGNTGTGASKFGMNDQPDSCGNGLTTSDFLHSGTDYFLDAGAKPGWSRYPYPHPLRQGVGSTSSNSNVAAPSGLTATVQ